MGVFSRIFKVTQSEAHAVIDKLEDPIKMTEQGIRDLKKDLTGAMESLAQVKAGAIRLKKDGENQKKLAADYERKAMMLLQKAQSGGIEVAEAERLATEVLAKKEDSMQRAQTLLTDQAQQQGMADQLQTKVNKLKQTVQRYENELITLKARARTAESMKKINKQMSKVDSGSTIAMLEKMKEKVDADESLAQAYGEMNDGLTLDDEIDKALESGAAPAGSDSLAELKKKMGM
ncbi:MAG: PspA/IM30 family protein [Calditrichia bacterium]|nr:PspA/IM30 family protein [Calditrichia bacterium]